MIPSQSHTLTHTHTHTRNHTHSHTTRAQSHTLTHAIKHTHTHARAQSHTLTHAITQTHTRNHTHSHTQSHTHTRNHTHSYAITHTYTRNHTHSRTHNYTHTHAITHTHSHTRMQSHRVWSTKSGQTKSKQLPVLALIFNRVIADVPGVPLTISILTDCCDEQWELVVSFCADNFRKMLFSKQVESRRKWMEPSCQIYHKTRRSLSLKLLHLWETLRERVERTQKPMFSLV